jgi:glycosyltransferase involved in cell wall biosynthesis
MRKAVIAIEARIIDPATDGGIAQVTMSLAQSLSRLEDGDEEYVFIAFEDAQDWLGKYISGPCRLHSVASSWKKRLAQSAAGPALLALRRRLGSVTGRGARSPATDAIPASDGVVEKLGANLVHFLLQRAYLTDRCSIYHPHDLQHIHFPEFFDGETVRSRTRNYSAFCAQARFVAVESTWTKQDVTEKLSVAAEKVVVIPFPPPVLLRKSGDPRDADRASAVTGFPRFIFYPAQTWLHKNHLRLIDALEILKGQFGLDVPLVCTGHQNSHFGAIERRIFAAKLSDQVRFLGYVDDATMAALYRTATAVVVPTLFESLSLPIWEAFAARKPVACSRIPSLEAQAAGAALLFDPDDSLDLAKTIKKLWEDDRLRAELGSKGRARIGQFSWDRTALHVRALYRKALDYPLDAEDRSIIEAWPVI